MKKQIVLSTSANWLRLSLILCVLLSLAAGRVSAEATGDARQIASAANFHGGLVIHIGCGHGQLTAALRLADNCTVQGLDTDPGCVEAARAAIRQCGLYGPVSVIRWNGDKLPYVDNLATLVVCEDLDAAPRAEAMRVLRPFGALVSKRDGKWQATFKPQLPGTDQWGQHFKGADNNAVAQDTVVGPPRRFQWVNTPEWQRSHLAMPSINSIISMNGRLFTVEDLASVEHAALPGKQALVARDAHNGVRLWQVMFTDWYPSYTPVKSTPVQIQRRLAASGDRVYCTPGYTEPITVFDAATGSVIKRHEKTAGTQEFVLDRDMIFAVTGNLVNPTNSLRLGKSLFPVEAYRPFIDSEKKSPNELMAVDANSGQERWRLGAGDMKGYQLASLCAIGDRVVFSTKSELVCLDRGTGKTKWRVPAPTSRAEVTPVLSDRAAYLNDGNTIRAFRLSTGEEIWKVPAERGYYKPADLFVTGGLVWTQNNKKNNKIEGGNSVRAYDPETGELIKEINQSLIGHGRCYRNRITTRYFINSRSGGSDFVDFEFGTEQPNPWIRSTCGIGPLPCNGLYYVGPPACSCNNNVLLNTMNALSAEPGLTRSDQPIQVKTDHTLTKGPAYSKISELKSASAVPADDWPTYRQNNARTGATRNKVPAELTKHWETKLGAGASAPIIAAGMVFAADVDGHAVCAINVTDGKIAWRFVADGRVDSPPTYYQGLLLFGSHDGTAYCLRAADGALVWRFAPLERRMICAYEQPESAWPICGSILVHKGLAYFAAGRNSFTDGGIFLYALDARSGKVIHHKRMYGPFGKNGLPVPSDLVGNSYMIEGFRSDVFVADEKRLYLGQQAFEPDLSPVNPQGVKQPHLIPSYGFLEAIPHHRSFWTIDTSLYFDIPTGRGGIHGDILAIDGKRFYEVRGYTPHRNQFFDPREKGYTLYAGTFGPYDPPKKNQLSTWLQNWKRNSDPSGIAPSNKLWASNIPLTGKAIVLAGDVVFVAGTPVVFPEGDLGKAYEGRMGGVLWAASASTGEKLAQYTLDAPPAWDGLAAAGGKLYLTTKDGKIICFVHNQ